MAAEVGISLVGTQHHGERIPAHKGADAVLEAVIAVRAHFLIGRDGVDVGGVGRVRDVDAGGTRQLNLLLDQVVGTLSALLLDHRTEGVEPLLGFLGVGVGLRCLHGKARNRGHVDLLNL